MFGFIGQALANAKLIAGTVPLHKGYLLLHHPLPPSAYPKNHLTISPLLSSIQSRAAAWGIQANLAYLETHSTGHASSRLHHQTEAEGTFFDLQSRAAFTLPKLTMTRLATELSDIETPLERVLQLEKALVDQNTYLLVCTHGQRDCRCGDLGGSVLAELQKNASNDVQIGELGHVGGHKWAANVLAFPSGDWFGNIQPQHVDLLLRYVEDGCSVIPHELIPHWRGGRGLSKDEQISLAQRWLLEQ
ncbi:hypothetical protein EXIGLDRAFT_761065 [Exidia glandulosa HHB12029]|uniref:Sucraseferredoxin-like protein n=1 Tax=Exidia glandulosa HHB12029 TaxID=1314781 RepID=A0A165NPX2_EXIGL|nr:hypothetical protein EXIGLDRAFT_761065 [Exidia glandulosa HHB12029]